MLVTIGALRVNISYVSRWVLMNYDQAVVNCWKVRLRQRKGLYIQQSTNIESIQVFSICKILNKINSLHPSVK